MSRRLLCLFAALLPCLSLAAEPSLTIRPMRVVSTWVDAENPRQDTPRWEDLDALTSPSGSGAARLIINNGWNDYGSVTVDLGVEVALGEVVLTHRQNGPGYDRSTDLFGGTDRDGGRHLARLGCPSDPTTVTVPFSTPVRYLKLMGGAGGQVGADSVWEFANVFVRCRPSDIRLSAFGKALREMLPRFQALPGLSESDRRLCARGRALVQRLDDAQAGLVSDPDAALRRLRGRTGALRSQAERVERQVAERLNRALMLPLFPGTEPPCVVSWESPLAIIRPGARCPASYAHLSATLDALRNETEAAQLAVVPLAGPLARVQIQPGELLRQGGKGSLGVPTVYRVGLVGPPERRWPDPLYLGNVATEVIGPQAFWISVKVPADAAPGPYRTQVKLSLNGAPGPVLPLEVRVHQAALPVTGKLKFVIGCGPGPEYYDDVLAHRMNPGGMACGCPADADYSLDAAGNLKIDFTGYDQAMERYIAAGLNNFGLPHSGGDGGGLIPDRMAKWATDPSTGAKTRVSLNPLDGPEATARFQRWAREFCDHLRDRGWLKYAFLYIWDEPSPAHFPAIAAISRAFREAVADVPIEVTASPCEGLDPWVDIYCPIVQQTGQYSSANDPRLAAMRAAGKELWWYNCGDPYPFPTFAVFRPTISGRVMFWLNWRLGFPGNLYWAVTHWPFSHSEAAPGGGGVADGMLYYPPVEPGVLVPSIRLECIRDGIEDYETLALLDQASGGRSPLLRVPDTIARDALAYTDDPAALESQRRAIITALGRAAGR